jgi:hypothetical protein
MDSLPHIQKDVTRLVHEPHIAAKERFVEDAMRLFLRLDPRICIPAHSHHERADDLPRSLSACADYHVMPYLQALEDTYTTASRHPEPAFTRRCVVRGVECRDVDGLEVGGCVRWRQTAELGGRGRRGGNRSTRLRGRERHRRNGVHLRAALEKCVDSLHEEVVDFIGGHGTSVERSAKEGQHHQAAYDTGEVVKPRKPTGGARCVAHDARGGQLIRLVLLVRR